MNIEILGVSWKKFNENLYPFFSANSVIILLWCMTALLDGYSTTKFMMVLGPESEMHPMTKSLSYCFGIYAGPYISGAFKILMALPILVCWKNIGRCVLTVSSIIQIYAFKANLETYRYVSQVIPEQYWWHNVNYIIGSY